MLSTQTKLFDVLINFYMTKGMLPPKRMRTTELLFSVRYLPMGPGLSRGRGVWWHHSYFNSNNHSLKQSLTNYSLETKSSPQPVFVNSFTGTQPHPVADRVSAFILQQQRQVVTIELISKARGNTSWPLQKVCWPLP